LPADVVAAVARAVVDDDDLDRLDALDPDGEQSAQELADEVALVVDGDEDAERPASLR
jgi:hypothetical protein